MCHQSQPLVIQAAWPASWPGSSARRSAFLTSRQRWRNMPATGMNRLTINLALLLPAGLQCRCGCGGGRRASSAGCPAATPGWQSHAAAPRTCKQRRVNSGQHAAASRSQLAALQARVGTPLQTPPVATARFSHPTPATHLRSCRPALASSRCVGMRAPAGSGLPSSCPAGATAAAACRPGDWPLPRRCWASGCWAPWAARMKRRSSRATSAMSAHACRARRCVSQPRACAVALNPPRRTMACRGEMVPGVGGAACSAMLECSPHCASSSSHPAPATLCSCLVQVASPRIDKLAGSGQPVARQPRLRQERLELVAQGGQAAQERRDWWVRSGQQIVMLPCCFSEQHRIQSVVGVRQESHISGSTALPTVWQPPMARRTCAGVCAVARRRGAPGSRWRPCSHRTAGWRGAGHTCLICRCSKSAGGADQRGLMVTPGWHAFAALCGAFALGACAAASRKQGWHAGIPMQAGAGPHLPAAITADRLGITRSSSAREW